MKTVSQWSLPVLSVAVLSGAVTLRHRRWAMRCTSSTVVPVFDGHSCLLILGNYLPKIRSRTAPWASSLPWTLQSEENWTRTHRLTGFLWVPCGLVIIPLSLLRLWSGWLLGCLAAGADRSDP